MRCLALSLSLAVFTAASAALGGAAPESRKESNAFYASLDPDAKILARFDSDLLRGASVQFPDHARAHAAAARMAAMPVVKRASPVHLYPRPKSDVIPLGNLEGEAQLESEGSFRNDTSSPHVMMQVDRLRALGVTGKGIQLAVIDDGVDYHHPALGRCFGKGCLVAKGYDLVGDAFNGSNEAIPDPDPLACGSHGTHVCGIIAAQPNRFGFTGVAPGVTLAVYKVFGCDGYTRTDVLISALLKAVEDGAQIVTVSIGSADGFTDDPWSDLASNVARKKGIPFTVAAGNDGSHGAFYPSGMADAPDVMSIASFDNVDTPTLFTLSQFSVNKGRSQTFGYVPGKPRNWTDISLPLWALSLDPKVPDDGCSPFPANTPDLSKFIVLIRRGTCKFTQKATNAAAKGAKYFMLYNDAPGDLLSISVTDATQIVASGMVTNQVGESWIKSLAAGQTVTLHMSDPIKSKQQLEVVKNTATGGAVSNFSSWGPDMEMDFKPQFGAPGGNILSTIPVKAGSFGVMSGTSMATPMTAGVIALLGQYRGTTNMTLIRRLLSATSKAQLYNQNDHFFDFLAPAAQQGAGLIQAFDAAMTTTMLDPPSLAFNDTEHLNKNLNFTITNHGKKAVSYRIAQRSAASVYVLAKDSLYPPPGPNEVVAASASLSMSVQQAVVEPGASQLIHVTAVPPAGIDERRLLLWSGYITVNGSDGSAMSLPYEGLAGSLRNSTTLPADASWIANSTDLTRQPVGANSTFVLPQPGQEPGQQDMLPYVAANLTLGSPTLVMSLAYSDAPPSEALSLWEINASPLLFATRGRSDAMFDGRLRNGTYVPAGHYKFVLKALRIAGNPLDSGDWDTSETPPFSILYRK
ncbi:hypothetical protein E4U42_006900 [Claviceps africana]|uniref:Subtilisin-like protease n=1 Tax=Claviceps africana TaxID=83212 RepID=A0A8K0NKZ7_9HYPO|nr:hypothetical protein E4U42_006900 [Claviceps africana]